MNLDSEKKNSGWALDLPVVQAGKNVRSLKKKDKTLGKIQPIHFWYSNCGLQHANLESGSQQGHPDLIHPFVVSREDKTEPETISLCDFPIVSTQ